MRLSIPDCEGASGAEIAKLVGLELAPGLATVLDDASPATLHATLQCADGRALITVVDPARAQPLELSLSLVETHSEARERFLALAIAELIATSRLERSSARKPPPGRSSSRRLKRLTRRRRASRRCCSGSGPACCARSSRSPGCR